MKPLSIVLICLTTLVLLGYPFVLIADLMAIASIQPGQALSSASQLFFYAFVGGTFFYPLFYLIGLIGSIWSLRKEKLRAALLWQVGVFVYLGLIAVAIGVSLYME